MILVQAQRIDERRERGGLRTAAWIVEKEARKRLAPVLEHTHQRPICEMRRGVFLSHERQRVVRDSRRTPIYSSSPRIAWLSADCDTASLGRYGRLAHDRLP
jgi:hypothetical protein